MMRLRSDGLVLVVDDVVENRTLARAYLEKLGWRVLEANSGSSAIDLLKTVSPTHILLDVKMPGLDGVSVAGYVRHSLNDADVRIVGYTAHALSEEVERFLASGFDAVLIKPVTYVDISNEFGTANTEFC